MADKSKLIDINGLKTFKSNYDTEIDAKIAQGGGGVSPEQKAIWDEKYDKPSGGIPKTDLASAVQTSLDKADTALQSVPAVSTSVAGLCPKLDGSTSKYLRADGTWATVQAGSSVVYAETKPTGQSNGCVWIASANV